MGRAKDFLKKGKCILNLSFVLDNDDRCEHKDSISFDCSDILQITNSGCNTLMNG
jgi:hypothetical protein